MTSKETAKAWDTDLSKGLSNRQIEGRLRTFGFNMLPDRKRLSIFGLLIDQFRDFMILVLMVATIISALMGEVEDAVTIMAIVILNALLGFIQEYRAERSLQALKELTAPEARVLRNGQVSMTKAKELVPGDLILLVAGDRVPADGRIIEEQNLEIDESLLTGESFPVEKNIDILTGEHLVAERKNMVHMGTIITQGRGQILVTSTGLDTEMGKIANMLADVQEEETPLQRKLHHLGKWLVWLCLLACAAVVGVGVLKGESVYHMFLAGVSLAVAAIPEGLPAIVTLSLAIGVQKMIKRNAIVRKLPAVETLGCATVICSDKTGTLTQNKMTVRRIYTMNRMYDFERKQDELDLKMTLEIGVYCNNANLITSTRELSTSGLGKKKFIKKDINLEKMQVIGDPTEGALLVAGMKVGITKDKLTRYQFVAEIPFDSSRKRMSVIVMEGTTRKLLIKGAPDLIIERCSRYQDGHQARNLSRQMKDKIFRQNEEMTHDALRVLAVAYRKISTNTGQGLNNLEEYEKDLIFVGLVGMIDPPRKEAKEAISRCRMAGIKPVMVTGDHRNTAKAIAKELGLLTKGDLVITGEELNQMDEKRFLSKIDQIAVYARVSPEDKLRIVRGFKKKGQIVAMTGDGVNDAPAVKEADIGIAMGENGTDVTRESSDLVLADDNFATIVAAVEEGRNIYDNIRKFIRYLLSCNIGEILAIFLGMVFGFPLPLLPIQILWVNLVTDGLPALALGVDPGGPDVMERLPRHPKESIFSNGLKMKIIIQGILIGLSTLGAFLLGYYWEGGSLAEARTMAFTTLVIAQLIFVFACRSERHSLWQTNIFSNIWLLLAVILSAMMQLGVLYLPALQQIFKTTLLNSREWIIILAMSSWSIIVLDIIQTVLHKTILKKHLK
ncbi:MAG: calcium-translocating P-type ATPase, SERCA-type [Halanaerobiales bacterium]|nr:calcium-translocating P-type ATPase, SERCA-type [Halanaerobiales bacterium]